MKNILGKKVGKYTVVGCEMKDNEIIWRCKNENGEIEEKSNDFIMHEKSKRYKNLIGKEFGKLTVIREAEKNRTLYKDWVCVCECGREKTVSSVDLKNGRVKSCGCLKDKSFLRKEYVCSKCGKNKIRIEVNNIKEFEELPDTYICDICSTHINNT